MPNNLSRPPVNRMHSTPGEIHPLTGAKALSDYIRVEHGREGVRRFLEVLQPLVPRDFIVQLAERVCEPIPPPLPPPPVCGPPPPIVPECDVKKPSGPNPEELMMLMQLMNKGKDGGIDPKLIAKLLQKKD